MIVHAPFEQSVPSHRGLPKKKAAGQTSRGLFLVKLSFLDATGHADFSAVTTVGALSIIDDRMVVHHSDCLRFALTLALLARNTADGANLADNSTLVAARASNNHTCVNRHDVDDLRGANLCASATANAKSGVNVCNAILDADCIIRTGCCTVATANTAVCTAAFAAVEQLSCLAGFITALEIDLVAGALNSTGALDDCNLRLNRFELTSECFSQLHCAVGTARDTKVGFQIGIVNHCLCIRIAAGKSASTTVCTGKLATDDGKTLVNRHSHDLGSNGQHNSRQSTNHGDRNDSS